VFLQDPYIVQRFSQGHTADTEETEQSGIQKECSRGSSALGENDGNSTESNDTTSRNFDVATRIVGRAVEAYLKLDRDASGSCEAISDDLVSIQSFEASIAATTANTFPATSSHTAMAPSRADGHATHPLLQRQQR
jgi:hypothetical protein